MKRRFVQDPETHELYEVSADVVPLARNSDAALWNDRAYQDACDPRFRSRTSHREFMRRKGYTTMDDYTEEWKKKAAARERFARTGYDPSRRPVIERALHEVFNEGKRWKPRHD